MSGNPKAGARLPASGTVHGKFSVRTDTRPTQLILLFLAALSLRVASCATAETTNDLSAAEIQGRQLAQQLLEQNPAANFIQDGILKIRDKAGKATNVFVSFQTLVTTQDWQTAYEAGPTTNGARTVILGIVHQRGQPNRYFLSEDERGLVKLHPIPSTTLNGNQTMRSFAASDFWIADLGLEFFHWPEQKVLPKTTNLKRSRDYILLESTNPNPSLNSYSRVLSWIDKETGGILAAEAYDAHGKLLKEFYPKDFKKVAGQWQVQSMEIDNAQTGSRTRLEFDVKKP
jgi:Outer membrane lipoprotein-sorting protein